MFVVGLLELHHDHLLTLLGLLHLTVFRVARLELSLQVPDGVLHFQHAAVLVGGLFVHTLHLTLLLDYLLLQFGVEAIGLLELQGDSDSLLFLLGDLGLEAFDLGVHVMELFSVLFVLFLQSAVLGDHLLDLLVLGLDLEVLLVQTTLQTGDGGVISLDDGLLVVYLLVVVAQLGLEVIQLCLVPGEGAVFLVFHLVSLLQLGILLLQLALVVGDGAVVQLDLRLLVCDLFATQRDVGVTAGQLLVDQVQ